MLEHALHRGAVREGAGGFLAVGRLPLLALVGVEEQDELPLDERSCSSTPGRSARLEGPSPGRGPEGRGSPAAAALTRLETDVGAAHAAWRDVAYGSGRGGVVRAFPSP